VPEFRLLRRKGAGSPVHTYRRLLNGQISKKLEELLMKLVLILKEPPTPVG
jgi:hypothetical protein